MTPIDSRIILQEQTYWFNEVAGLTNEWEQYRANLANLLSESCLLLPKVLENINDPQLRQYNDNLNQRIKVVNQEMLRIKKLRELCIVTYLNWKGNYEELVGIFIKDSAEHRSFVERTWRNEIDIDTILRELYATGFLKKK